MDHSTAQKLMKVYERMGNVINEADDIIRTLAQPERSAHLQALAGAMQHLWLELQLPIVREHRDLDPDGDRFQNKSSGQ